jgi:hypothetical protein
MATINALELTNTLSLPSRSVDIDFAPSLTTFALDSNYGYNSGGDSFYIHFLPPETGTLTDFWIAVDTFGNTWGSTDGVLNWAIHGPGLHATLNAPIATVAASGTLTLAGTESKAWVRKSGLSVSVNQGEPYALTIGDADGTANHAIIALRSGGAYTNTHFIANGFTTANGYTTSGTSTTQPLHVAVKIAGRTYIGHPWYTSTAISSSTLWRGNRIVVAPDCPPFAAPVIRRNATLFAGTVRVYEGASKVPNDTPAYENVPFSTGNGSFSHMYRFWPRGNVPVFMPGKTYYYVFKPTSNGTTWGQKFTTFSGLDDDLRSALSGIRGVTVDHCLEVSGGASWTIDTDKQAPHIWGGITPIPITTATVACG